MRTLAFGLLVVTLPAMLLGCAVDTTSPVANQNQDVVNHELSGGASSPPDENEPAPQGSARTVQSRKTVTGLVSGPTEDPQPEPWKGDHHPGSGGGATGTQKKDGPLHTKIRDMIEPPDDGKNP